MVQIEAQHASLGGSDDAIHQAVIAAAAPAPGLSWLDIGCGRGELLAALGARWAPTRLAGIDIIDWLDPPLHDTVEMHVGPAEERAADLQPFDRVLLVEVLEHLEAPWTVLRAAARAVRPGGRLVLSTPNVATARHRLELLTAGRLTAFRPDHPPHLQPILPHVAARVLEEEGLTPNPVRYALPEKLPKVPGRVWPAWTARWPRLTMASVIVSARR